MKPMQLSGKVRFLNFFRNIFRIRFLEKRLSALTFGRSPNHIFSKLVPNAYQYPPGSFRTVYQNDIKLVVDISDYMGHYLYFGFHDPTINVLFSLCKEDSCVIDVGVNIGWTFLNLTKRCPNGKSLGFEPDSDNFKVCWQNLMLNKFENAMLLQKGLGDESKHLTMEVRTRSNRGGNRIAPDGLGNESVSIERLDEVQEIKDWPRVDLIKMDVEGYELHDLKGRNLF
jgi:FkbM family methyltransferase